MRRWAVIVFASAMAVACKTQKETVTSSHCGEITTGQYVEMGGSWNRDSISSSMVISVDSFEMSVCCMDSGSAGKTISLRGKSLSIRRDLQSGSASADSCLTAGVNEISFVSETDSKTDVCDVTAAKPPNITWIIIFILAVVFIAGLILLRSKL